MIVRRAALADGADIASVHVRTWQAAYAHVFGAERLAGLDVRRRTAGWERSLREGETVFVADEGGRVVGFAAVGPSRDDADEAELYAIYALPESWGSGAGPALLGAGLEEMRAAGYEEAVLWVLEDNPRARRFYAREGFEPDGGPKEESVLGMRVVEVRLRLRLAPARRRGPRRRG